MKIFMGTLPVNNVMGVNNLNQLVHQQLGSQAYDVVRTIHDNITWLYQLYQNKDNLIYLQRYVPQLNVLLDTLSEIQVLKDSMLVQADLKELSKLSSEYLNWKIGTDALKEDIKKLDLPAVAAIQREIETKLTELNAALNSLDSIKAEQIAQCRILKHLCANDATRDALEFPTLTHLPAIAWQAIKESEAAGNDESLNKVRLGVKQ